MVLASTGEDAIIACPDCGYGANVEKAQTGAIAPAPPWTGARPAAPEAVHTPEMKSVEEVAEFLGVAPSHLVKTMVFETDQEFVVALVRGDREVNEVKLKNALGCTHLQLATPEKIEKVTGGPMGFSGPVGLPASSSSPTPRSWPSRWPPPAPTGSTPTWSGWSPAATSSRTRCATC